MFHTRSLADTPFITEPYTEDYMVEKVSAIMMVLRINETLQTGTVRKPRLPFSRLVGIVSNSADAVRLETAPTGGESVYLFLGFTINVPLK